EFDKKQKGKEERIINAMKSLIVLGEEKKEVILRLLAKAGFSKSFCVEEFAITISDEKWKRLKRNEDVKSRGRKPLNQDEVERITNWLQTEEDESILRPTVRSMRKKKDGIEDHNSNIC